MLLKKQTGTALMVERIRELFTVRYRYLTASCRCAH